MDQDGLAGLEFRIVEQHVLDGRECDRCTGRIAKAHTVRYGDREARGHVEQLAGKPIDVETHGTLGVLAQVLAPVTAGAAFAAGEPAIHDDAVAGLERADIGADFLDLAGRLRTDHQRQLAPRKRHTPPSPHVDVVESHGTDANLHLADGRWRRGRDIGELELAVSNQSERTHVNQCPRRTWSILRNSPTMESAALT